MLGLLMLAGCVPHRTPPFTPKPIIRDRWAAQEIRPETYQVYVADGIAEAAAMKELCNTVVYLCTVESAGRIIVIQRSRK